MPAPEGNQFWKLRKKHGKDKKFNTAEVLWEAACEYFQWCDNNPFKKIEVVKGGKLAGTLVKIPTARPYTLHGLCLYLGVNTKYFNDLKDALKEKPDKNYSEVITRIEETIYCQKFEGAVTGFFNANIIARDLGLTDKKDLTTAGDKINTIPSSIQVEVVMPQEED
jgi:DNA-packaging protein gp3|nr:MAG TPA: Terminase small subunit [Caudoviricetes sp.]